MLFFVSFLLLAWCALRLCSRFAASPADSFWLAVAASMLQVGSVAGLTSALHQLNPVAWIGAQILVCAIAIRFTGGMHAPSARRVFARCREFISASRAFVSSLSTWGATALMLIVLMLVVSAITQIATPIHIGDDKRYHASRVIYWIQNASVFPFITHNDRQNITPFGSELFFLWPVLFTRTELIGRLVFWTAYPCVAIGQYILLRAMKLGTTAAMVGSLILITTPLVAASAIGLTPEIWSILALVGASYWLVTICLDSERSGIKCFWLGVFTMLAMNVRPFALAMVPGVILIPLLTHGSVALISRTKAVVAGLVVGCMCSGLVIPLGFNTALYHHPLGPAGARRAVMADISPRQIYTHVVRFVFVLLDLPDVAIPPETRARIGTLSNRLISDVGADIALPLEVEGRWPGRFSYSLSEHATRFSLWGMVWIPTLLIALIMLARNVMATWPQPRLAVVPAQLVIALPVLVGILVASRWMADSQVPARYLIGPYALALPIGLAVAVPFIKKRKVAESLALLAVAVCVYQPLRSQLYDAARAVTSPVTDADVNAGFEEALDLIPSSSRILLVGGQSAPDYPLFSPSRQYANTVIPWGKTPFDPERMHRVIESQNVTHVLIQDDEAVVLQWDPDVRTGEMVAWLNREPGLDEITLAKPRMRLFETNHNTQHYERPFQTTAVPSSAPLITIGSTLQQQVGIDPVFLKTPWAIEGDRTRAWLWMGQGREEGLALGLWSRQERQVDLRFDVAAGPSLTTPDRTVMLLLNGALVSDRTFQGTAALTFPVTLRAGRNVVEFVALDAPNAQKQPNDDPRRLVVLLNDVRAERAEVHAEKTIEDGLSTAAHIGAMPGEGLTGLSQLANRATTIINSKQQVPGYWLTAYTTGTRFGRPQFEMNTYTTSVMIDALDPVAVEVGLAASLQRARQHLSSQIEAGGLVRYHGRPDASTIGSLGCRITPDADDTALVWRIAPGPHRELLAPALDMLAQYRRADGLYRTWLAPQAQYQCLDPGTDPDPADATIQMHVLMLLARADPPAAHALCSALQQSIDRDGSWVYYSRAPLVPMLRQIDMHQSGCALPLPVSRTRASAPEQDVWLDVAGVLQRLSDPKADVPSSTAVADLLRRLSNDDFAFVRQFPPLMYHNDLTATVPRFYWSDDFGYALWLRLYVESERRGLLDASRAN